MKRRPPQDAAVFFFIPPSTISHNCKHFRKRAEEGQSKEKKGDSRHMQAIAGTFFAAAAGELCSGADRNQ